MGTDCYLIVNDEKRALDRWYVFSRRVRAGKEYTPEEFSKVLDELEKDADESNNPRYWRHWIQQAREMAKDQPVVMWDESRIPDKYFDLKLPE